MDEEPRTEELREHQLERERIERERARATDDPDEEATHARRAEKSAYLRRKLEERAETERDEPA